MASRMSSLMDLVSQNQPRFQTHQALLVIGLQNDFIQPDGRLPVSTKSGYLERIQTLIPKFRELNGNVIWVQTLYEGDRIANDANTGEGDTLVVGGLIDGDESSTEGGEEEVSKDLPQEKSRSAKHKQRALDLFKRVSARRKALPQEVARATAEQDDELFLLKSEKKTPACVPDTYGAQFADVIARQFELPADMVIKTTNYSAFQGTSLLMTLRAKLVTELYICGCISNVSVLATVIDAARHGIKINVVEDCLGYRKQTRHDLALKRMDEFFDAYLVNSTEILSREPPAPIEKKSTSPSGSRTGSKGSERQLETMTSRLSLNDADARPSSRPQSVRLPSKVLVGGPRKLSLISVAEGRRSLSSVPTIESVPEPSDEQFVDQLVTGAKILNPEKRAQDGESQEIKMVTKKIRMRSKGKKKKKKKEGDEDVSKAEAETAPVTGEPSVPETHGTTEAAQPVLVTEAVDSTPQTQPVTKVQRPAQVSKTESSLNLREKLTRQRSLKTVASQPVLSAKIDSKDRESWTDRVRMSLSRAPKSDSASESRNRTSIVSTTAPSIRSMADSRPVSVVVKPLDTPSIPEKAPEPTTNKTSESPFQQPVESPAPEPAPTSPTSGGKHTKVGKTSKLQSLANFPILGPGDTIAEGDSRIINDFFPPDFKHPTDPSIPLRDLIFTQLYNEVRWQKMLHQQGEVPRLVCCQGDFGGDGSMPVYRHPADQTLPLLHFSPKVHAIRKQAEKLVGHPLNHVLIQMYRSGNDYISEHSDKTLDIVKGSSIVNVSFGAQRTMRLRTKKALRIADDKIDEEQVEESQRSTQRVAMPHNSMFVLGLASNAKWLHGIMPDKRAPIERSDHELAFNGIRISLTFRHIGTFLDAKESVIWGQGATAKDQRDAADVVNGDEEESERVIRAFSRENHHAEFDWEEWYGGGFDVLHLHTPPGDTLPILFASNNAIEARQAQIGLAEAKIEYTLVEAPGLEKEFEKDRQVAFRDNDALHTEVSTSSSILLYLDRYHPLDKDDRSRSCTANAYPIILLASEILIAWSNIHLPTHTPELATLLACLEERLATEGGPFIAGRRFSIADCFVWPIVDEVVGRWDAWDEERYGKLGEWYRVTWRKKASVKKVKEKVHEKKSIGKGDGDRV
jgi:nicotinamidase-related amidase/glutathione S-transferase